MRKGLIILAIVLFLLTGAALALWLVRGAIVTSVISGACEDRGLACTTDKAQISLTDLRLTGLSIADPGGTEVAKTDLDATLSWPSFLSPSVTSIRLSNAPRLDLTYNERGFFLGEVPVSSLMSTEQSDAALPSITIEPAKLSLETPAGQLAGTLSAVGDFPDNGVVELLLEPADLAQGTDRLTLTEGILEIALDDGQLGGSLSLAIEEASFPGQRLRRAQVKATLPETDHPHIDWQLSAAAISDDRLGTFEDVEASGQTLLFDTTLAAPDKILESFKRFSATFKAGRSSILNRNAEQFEATLLANRTDKASDFTLSAEAAFNNGTGPFGKAQTGTLTLSGQARQDLSAFVAQGRIVTSGVAASLRAKSTMTGLIPVSVPFEAHGESLRKAFENALDGFSASADFGLSKPQTTGVTLTLNGPVALKAKTGANLLLSPQTGQAAVINGPDGLTLSGLLSSRGGAFPDATILIHELRQTQNVLSIRTGGIDVRDWRAGGMTLSMDLTDLNLKQAEADGLHVAGNGSLRFDGPLLGVTISDGELFGNLDAARTQSGWRVQTQNQTCIGLDYSRLRLAKDLSLGAAALKLCPPDGRVLSSNSEGAFGAINLGDVSLPVFGNRFTGSFDLKNAALDWSGGENLDMTVTANGIDLPLQIDQRDLRIEARAARMRIEVAQNLTINGALGATKLSGQLVPAKIEMSALNLNGQFAGKGFLGSAQGQDVRIRDYRDDPIYQPLLGTLNARFDGAQMALEGPFRLARTGNFIGNVNADINLLSLSGTASMDIPTLSFARGALQPKNISGRLEGVFTSATGSANGKADFDIDGGHLSGRGRFSVSDLYIETARLGPIYGINGQIEFDDLIKLSTPPGQTVTIDRLNPGIPLEDGVLKFQIIEGRQARLESAIWPFAGGELDIKPNLWTIGGTEDTIEVRADKIELKDLIETLKVPDLKAEGTVSGVFPIQLRAGATYINNARFQVDEAGGSLSYQGAALSGAGGANQTVNDAFRALENFQYTVLELSLNGNLLGDITLGALLLGKNPDVLGGSEFEFDISIDSKLAQLLQTGRQTSTQQWLAEAVALQVEDKTAQDSPPQE